ncbi:DUF333 domain-containing protein [Methanocalculus sp. MSAO_Arc2]|uniref:DUF333 domain-containing protein n=1 Tax=Methanocalculus sp. MSAO_Arc2 TaxID=2293855 RepID=UPI0026D6568E
MRAIFVILAMCACAAIFLVAAGCVNDEPPKGPEITGIGVVQYIDLEGGFYGIVADDGKEYLPLNLPEELKVDGTEVTFRGVIKEDVVTIYMWGTPLQITRIQKDAAEQYIIGTGVITYIDLEGGFYGILSEEGRFLPITEEYQDFIALHVDRLVDFTVQPKDVATIHQWGQPVEIIAISLAEGELPPTISGTGTVTYIDLEGGFYGILADDGREYLPLNLPEELKVDGTEVTFSGVIKEDVATIFMWGTPLQITRIQKDAAEPYIIGTGVITYIDLEGGFYGILSEEGRFLPITEEYQDFIALHVDRLVDFTVQPKDVATIYQWGQPVGIIAISLAEGELPPTISGTGTVTYIDLEGGFYGIICDDDRNYLPLNLEENYKIDGLSVSFVAEVEDDVMTIYQWGTPVTLVSIEAVD